MPSEVKRFVQQFKSIRGFFVRPSRRIIGALIIGAILFGPGIYDLARMLAKQRKIDRQLAELSSRKERLTLEQKRLETDSGYVEGLIRSTFKMSQPGEYVIPLSSNSSHRPAKRLASE